MCMKPPAQKLAVAAIAVALLVTGAVSPANGSEPDPAPVKKENSAPQERIPLDITGDAALSGERDHLDSLLSALAEVDGGSIWNPKSQVLTIRMTSDAALEQARETVASSQTKLATDFVRVQYSAKELDELADRLLVQQLDWAGATGIGGGHDPVSNRVLLQVDPNYKDASTLIRAIKALNDPRVTLEYIEPVGNWAPENRVDDFQPWTAGAAIDSTSSGCTLGWAWRRWANNQVVGSTARHCANLYWYNNGTYVGTVFQSNQPTDSALMSGTTYSPTVFVGNQTTSVLRRVVAIDTAWNVGDSVAMSGRTSGLTVSTVKLPTYTLPSCAGTYAGLVGVLMKDHFTAGGDSGGPWLTTQSGTGYAVAHGQHFGFGCATNYSGSFFIKLNSISAAQSASILLW